MLAIYRLALLLCPPAFRREFGEEMLRDAADARADALAVGTPRSLWRWRAQMLIDVARTAATQWLRTGVPMIAFVAAIGGAIPLAAMTVLGALAQRLLVRVSGTITDVDTMGLVLVATLLVCLISITVVITLWAARLQRRIRPVRR